MARDPVKHREGARRYYANHRDEIRAKVRARYEANREQELAYKRQAYRANREAILAATAEQRAAYRHSERGRALIGEGVKRWAERNPEKRKAQQAVSKAIASERLTKQPCEICGTVAVHAHHAFGYAKDMQLAVWWLCSTHHFGMHVAMRGMNS